MLFEPVWISSTEHLATFETIYRQTSWLRRLRGAYNLPADFPCVRLPSGSSGRQPVLPIVMFAQGQVRVENGAIHFEAMDWPTPSRAKITRCNLRTEWTFAIQAGEVVSVEPFPYKSPILRYYDMPFTRIRTQHSEVVLHDFLVCVGGTGPSMSHIQEQSVELATALQSLKR